MFVRLRVYVCYVCVRVIKHACDVYSVVLSKEFETIFSHFFFLFCGSSVVIALATLILDQIDDKPLHGLTRIQTWTCILTCIYIHIHKDNVVKPFPVSACCNHCRCCRRHRPQRNRCIAIGMPSQVFNFVWVKSHFIYLHFMSAQTFEWLELFLTPYS